MAIPIMSFPSAERVEQANEHLFRFIIRPRMILRRRPSAIPENGSDDGVLIRYGGSFGLPMSLIAEMSQDVELKTIVSSVSTMNSVISLYQSGGVNLANCTF